MDGQTYAAGQQEADNGRHEVKYWDTFRNTPTKSYYGSSSRSKFVDIGIKFLKAFTIVLTFCVVLCSAVVSKGTLLFMTSQVKKNITRSYCSKNIDVSKQLVVSLPEEERVVWMWLIIFTFFVPELGTFLRSVRIICFKTWTFPTVWEFICVSITESLATIGSAFLVFIVLPELDVIKGAMLTNAVCFIPGLLALLSRTQQLTNNRIKLSLDVAAIVAQVSAFLLWPLLDGRLVLYFIPISLLFISFGWWENFTSKESPIRFIRKVAEGKTYRNNKAYFIYSILAPWKCLLFLLTTVIINIIREGDSRLIFDLFSDAFRSHNITITEVISEDSLNKALINGYYTIKQTSSWTPIAVWLINISATYVCYLFGKFACKIMIQKVSFALPTVISVPILLTAAMIICVKYNQDICTFEDVIPPYLFFNVPSLTQLKNLFVHGYCWVWLVWVLSQVWITRHVWRNNNEKMSSTEELFLKPMYHAYLIDQSVALNRRIEKVFRKWNTSSVITEDSITRVYACGTMWHESKAEMIEFLKSILRMDEDHCAHRIVKTYLHHNMSSYYEFETHILFDDAFIRTSKEDKNPHINDFVVNLIESVNLAASEVYRTNIRVKPPHKFTTPYGGRLVWTLPGGTKMIAHLKDKAKIRAKKRWSQVMYMYYLLGYGIMENDRLTANSISVRSENTYILALDGDIDFQPHAVHLLIDLMKKNKSAGAACGRLHPVGSGVMAWYQKFEYAISHWLWKATEDITGSVLCSPGCFSIFRAKALMDDNVMAKFTTIPEKAQHCVQYDQGEDRWLCTLLLQRGHRVQYCSAADAYTHCPEGLKDFYIQRKRWIPSNTANNIDLVTNYQYMIKNDSVSRLYILYQIVLLIGSIIGSGIIFLMLIEGFIVTFGLDPWVSFACNVVPVLLFVIICCTCKSDTQLFFAGIISSIYGLVMIGILVDLIVHMQENGWLSPSSLFVVYIVVEFIAMALLHPQEIHYLIYGIIYYVAVPSVYILLIIYSAFNMNNISWGTREVTIVPKQKVETEAKEGKKESKKRDNAGCCELSCGDVFKVMCCTHPVERHENETERNLQLPPHQPQQELELEQFDTDISNDCNITHPNGIQQNSWFNDGELVKSQISHLDEKEVNFWKALLNKYLHPLDDMRKKENMEKDLKELRDKIVIIYFTINSFVVLVIFLLALQKYELKLSISNGSSCDSNKNEVCPEENYVYTEAVTFILFLCFAVLMVIQFISMTYHRFSTYAQIMANTSISLNLFKSEKNNTGDHILEKDSVSAIKKIVRQAITDEEDKIEGSAVCNNPVLALALKRQTPPKPVIEDLKKSFDTYIRTMNYHTNNDKRLPISKKTLETVRQNMDNIEKKMSQKFQSNGEMIFDNVAYEEHTFS